MATVVDGDEAEVEPMIVWEYPAERTVELVLDDGRSLVFDRDELLAQLGVSQ